MSFPIACLISVAMSAVIFTPQFRAWFNRLDIAGRRIVWSACFVAVLIPLDVALGFRHQYLVALVIMFIGFLTWLDRTR